MLNQGTKPHVCNKPASSYLAVIAPPPCGQLTRTLPPFSYGSLKSDAQLDFHPCSVSPVPFFLCQGEGIKQRMYDILPSRQFQQIRFLQRRTTLSIYRLFICYPWCHSRDLGLPTQLCVCVLINTRRKYVKKKDASTVQPHDLSCRVFCVS